MARQAAPAVQSPLELRAPALDALRSETSLGILLFPGVPAVVAVVAFVLAATGSTGRLWFFGSLFATGALMLTVAVLPDRLTLRADQAGLGLERRTWPGGRRYGWVLPWSQIHGFRARGRWVELLVTEEPGAGAHPEDPPRWERLTGGSYGRRPTELAALLEQHRLAAVR